MTKVIELTFAESVDINRVNSCGVLQGMYDLLDELVMSLDDDCAQDVYEKLKERIDIVDRIARKNFQFKVTQ